MNMNETSETNYYVMRAAPSLQRETAAKDGYVEIEDWEAPEGFEDWGRGTVAENQPENPVIINLVPYGGYAGIIDEYKDMSVPLMSKRLKEAIMSAGVDNLKFWPITLRNTETEETYDYFAFNLIGRLDAVDLRKSTMASHDGDYFGDTAITDLSIDESATRGLLMFRLEQRFSVILVHRKVKEAIERAGITSVKFIAPEDFMAL